MTFGTTLAAQIALPRILQLRLSEGEYVCYVAVFAVVAYLGLADGGLLLSVMREMSEAHGRGERQTFAAEARRASRVFTGTALVGGMIAFLAIGSAIAAAQQAWPGAAATSFKLAVAVVLVASCMNIGFGSYHTALLFSTGRLLLGQVISVTLVVVPLLGLIVTLIVKRDLTLAMLIYGGVLGSAAALRGLHARRLRRAETKGVKPGRPLNPFGRVIGAGIAIKTADVLPTAAFPHALSVLAPAHVPVAVPARTLANGTRLISQQFLNLLQVHITRRMAGDVAARARGSGEYRQTATFLAGAHLLQIGVVAALAPVIFALWLPMHAPYVRLYLPGMLAEQALLSAAMPSSVLFAAGGRLRTLGVAKILGVAAGLLVFLVALYRRPEAAYGYGLAVSAVPFFATGMFIELRPLPGFPTPDRWTVARYACATAAALAALAYSTHVLPLLFVLATAVALLLPWQGYRLWRRFLSPT